MPPALTALKPIHELVGRLRMEGKTNEEIEQLVNVKRRTLYRWFSEPLLKQYMQKLADEIHAEFRTRVASIGVSALDRMHELMVAQPEDAVSIEQQIQIAKDIMDRTPGLQKTPEGSPPPGLAAGGNINMLNFAQMEDEDLVKLARGMAGEIAAAAKPQLPEGD